MLDGTLMLQVNLPVVDAIHPQCSNFVTVLKIKATSESKLNGCPASEGEPYQFSYNTELLLSEIN